MIRELDRVLLTADIAEEDLRQGGRWHCTVGQDSNGYEVESLHWTPTSLRLSLCLPVISGTAASPWRPPNLGNYNAGRSIRQSLAFPLVATLVSLK